MTVRSGMTGLFGLDAATPTRTTWRWLTGLSGAGILLTGGSVFAACASSHTFFIAGSRTFAITSSIDPYCERVGVCAQPLKVSTRIVIPRTDAEKELSCMDAIIVLSPTVPSVRAIVARTGEDQILPVREIRERVAGVSIAVDI